MCNALCVEKVPFLLLAKDLLERLYDPSTGSERSTSDEVQNLEPVTSTDRLGNVDSQPFFVAVEEESTGRERRREPCISQRPPRPYRGSRCSRGWRPRRSLRRE